MAPRSSSRSGAGASDEPAAPTSASSSAGKGATSEARYSTSVSAPFNVFGAVREVAKPPLANPSFSVKDIRAAIPAHCFERSAFWSTIHLLTDLAKVAALGAAATYIQTAPAYAQPALWVAYWLAQGCVMTGVWVLAHECGHQAYSKSKFINDTVGWFAHSALLVPYHSWRLSHAKHHKNTCSVEHDEVFASATRSYYGELFEETPLAAAWNIFVMLTFGW